LLRLNGVKKADVDWKKGEAKVLYDPKTVGVEEFVQAVAKAGFKVKSVQ
jgi:copper chaperone CopZ